MYRVTRLVVDKQARFREGDTWRHAKVTPKLKRKRNKAAKWAAKYM